MRYLSTFVLVGLCSCADGAEGGAAPADVQDGNFRAGSDDPAVERASASKTRFRVGTVATMLGGVSVDDIKASRRYTFPAGPFGQASAIVDDLHVEAGKLSMTGKALDSNDSAFMLKADDTQVYGWLVYRDKDIAFEYTTDAAGDVAVEEVPVTKIFPVCHFHPPPNTDDAELPPEFPQFQRSALMPAHIGMYDGSDVTKLQSLPGASKVWYIDMTSVMNGQTPIGQTTTDVWQTWQSLAATLSAFDVNVTTDRAVYMAAGVANSGVAKMANIDEGSSSCGLNIFGSTWSCDIHRYRNGYSTGRILAHEVGHGLGLSHDGGDNGGEYFNGFSAFQWTPLMGNVWPGDRWMNALYQWSKGEYASATQKEDDFARIDRHLDYREDDIASSVPLRVEGSSLPAGANWGQIGKNTDTDSFSFRVGASGGRADLKVDRIEYMGGAMLDVDASIVSSSGMVMAQHNADVARHAELDVMLPAGEYTLLIKGGAEGNMSSGFTNYSSVGFYGIEGTLTGAVDSGSGGAGGVGGSGGGATGGGSAGLAGTSPGGSAGAGGSAATSAGSGGTGGSSGPGSAGAAGAMPGVSGALAMAGSAGSAPAASPPASDSGCGCRVAGGSNGSAGWLLGIAAFVLLRRRPTTRARKSPAHF